MASMPETSISNPGQKLSEGDRQAQFLKIFAGEVLTAFTRSTQMMGRHIVRTIAHGKSASFPIMGRAVAQYLKPGENLDDKRKRMEANERIIPIDGLLTSDVLITDIDDAMNHYDVRAEYSKQLGEALAVSADIAVINELANLCAKGSGSAMGENIPTKDGKAGTGKAFEIVTGVEEAQTKAFGDKLLEAMIKARAQMTNNFVPAGDRYCLVTPEGYSAIIKALMPDSANYQALFDPSSGKLMNVCGFEVIETPYLHNEGVGLSTDIKHKQDTKFTAAKLQGLIFHRSAVGTVKLRDLAMERARRPEYQADQIIAKYAMGHGGLRPEAAGVIVQTAQVGG